MPDSRYLMPGELKSGIRFLVSGIQNPGSIIQNPESSIQNPASSIQYLLLNRGNPIIVSSSILQNNR
jgi:hypothetical protein